MHRWFFVALMLRVIGMDGWFDDSARSAGTPAVVQDDGGSVSTNDGGSPPKPSYP
jgi:hypothetical protein